MGDDQIGLDVGALFQRLVDRVRVPDGVLETAATVLRLFRGPAAQLILDHFDAGRGAGSVLREESTAKALLPDQPGGDVAKLSREVLVDE